MKPAKWLLFAVVAAGVLTLLVDQYFRSLVSPAGADGARAVLIASEGILLWRRAVHLTCSASGQARIVAKVRFEFQDPLRPGARTDGSVRLSAFERRLNPAIQLDLSMTITATGWFDTLESDPLDQDVLERLADGLGDPKLDFMAVHTLEHGFYFERSRLPDLQPLEPCLPKIRNA